MLSKIRILFKIIFLKLLGKSPVVSDSLHAKVLYLCEFGRLPDLKHPRTFNQHISSLKISEERRAYSKYTDKYAVRDYVVQKLPEGHLNCLLGVYDTFEQIDFDALPDEFVLKATHGSGYNIIVRDKRCFDKNAARMKFEVWLGENYYLKVREKNYKDIKPKIICETLLKPQNGRDLEEFKFFCFYGRVKFIQHNAETAQGRRSNLYDADWNLLPVVYGYKNFSDYILPQNTAEMVELAEKLSSEFDFVRVDLYNVDGNVYFSELTFNPSGGHIRFRPQEYDDMFGKYFERGKQ